MPSVLPKTILLFTRNTPIPESTKRRLLAAKNQSLPIVYDGYKYEDNEGIHLILTEGDAKTATEGQAVSYLLRSGRAYDPSTQSSSTKVSIANAPEADGDDDGEL